jgi:RNA polymerase primary sigma factor
MPASSSPPSALPHGAYLAVDAAPENGKERFDRVISDKHVESRERYLKALAPHAQGHRAARGGEGQVRGVEQGAGQQGGEKDRKRRSFDQTRDKLSNLLDKLFFKQKAIEDLRDRRRRATTRAQLLARAPSTS